MMRLRYLPNVVTLTLDVINKTAFTTAGRFSRLAAPAVSASPASPARTNEVDKSDAAREPPTMNSRRFRPWPHDSHMRMTLSAVRVRICQRDGTPPVPRFRSALGTAPIAGDDAGHLSTAPRHVE